MDAVPRDRGSRPGAHARWAEGILLAVVLLLAATRARPPAPPGPPPPADALVHRIDLNRAAWYELVDLPGIGEARARRIVADRRARGRFRSARDLVRVRGIGPATVEEVEAFIAREGR